MGDDFHSSFPPRRDDRQGVPRPIPWSVEAVDHKPMDTRASNMHLLRDCLALGKPVEHRLPAKVRLEEALGPELAQKLLSSLAAKRP